MHAVQGGVKSNLNFGSFRDRFAVDPIYVAKQSQFELDLFVQKVRMSLAYTMNGVLNDFRF